MSQNKTYDHQTTIRVSEEMWADIVEHARKAHIVPMEWIRRACTEKMQRVDNGDEIIPVNGMSYRDLEKIIRKVCDKSFDDKMEELEMEIEEMDKEMKITNNKKPRSPSKKRV